MAVRDLSNGNPDGARVGQSATEKLSFYGATPIVRGAAVATVATNDSTTNFSVAINALILRLQTVGLIA